MCPFCVWSKRCKIGVVQIIYVLLCVYSDGCVGLFHVILYIYLSEAVAVYIYILMATCLLLQTAGNTEHLGGNKTAGGDNPAKWKPVVLLPVS